MQAFVFNVTTSQFNRQMEAMALRAAYLLGSRPVLAGLTSHEVFFTQTTRRLTVLQKLLMLVDFHKNDPETAAIFQDMHDKMKEVADVKAKTKEQRAARKSMDQSVDKCFVPMVQNVQNLIDNFGFGVIRELKDEKIFGYLPTNINPETANDLEIVTSELMQLLVVESDDIARGGIYDSPELFFFGNEFLADTYTKPPIHSVTDAEAANNASIYLHHAFTFPPVNELMAAQLQTARSQLQPHSSAFLEAVDEWCYRCYDNESPASRLSVFRQQLLPAAATLQQALENNEILQQCGQQHSGHSPVEVWIGEMPVFQLWQYYRDFDALKDDTWQKLQLLKDDPGYAEQRWPVMMLKATEPSLPGTEAAAAEKKEEDKEVEEEIKPVRKYLTID